MSEFGEGPPQDNRKKESKQVSRRTLLKGLGGAVLALGGYKGAQEVSKRVETPSPTPLSSESKDQEKIVDHPPVTGMFVGEVNVYLGRLQDENTLQKEQLNFRKYPRTSDKLIDNRTIVTETIPTDKIKSINGVELNGAKWINITNPVLVKGEDVERADGGADNWVRLELVVDNTFGRDDTLSAYINFSSQTEGFVTGIPNPEAPNGGGFVPAQEVGGSIQVLEQGAFWKPAPAEVGVVTIPEQPQQ